MRLRKPSALVALAALAGACGGPEPSGVAMREYELSVRLGPEQVAAAQKGAEAFPPSFNPGIDTGEFAFPRHRSSGGGTTRTPGPGVSCPTANPNATPRLDPTTNVAGLAPVGRYRWRVQGERKLLGMTVPVDLYEQRLVQNARRTGPATFAFETVQPTLAGTEIVTYEVRTAATSQDVSAGSTRVVAGEPERGIVLRRIERFDRDGNPVGEFDFGIGLLVLPLPVRPGEHFTSTAVDRTNGITMQNEGTVLNKDRVDACGEPVDGWVVAGRLARSSPRPNEPSTVAEYRYIVGTQYGGMLLREEIDRQGDPNDTVKLNAHIAGLDPAPLPEAGR